MAAKVQKIFRFASAEHIPIEDATPSLPHIHRVSHIRHDGDMELIP
jgi:hypothetical protein